MRSVFLRCAAASTTGHAHLRAGEPCQDAVARAVTGSTVAVCLADGAGSASASELGAAAATGVVVELLCSQFSAWWSDPGSVPTRMLAPVLAELGRVASSAGVPVDQLACTLLFAAATVRGGRVRHLCGNLGDGVILQREDDQVRLCLGPENGEFANQTWFVTSRDASAHFRVVAGEVPLGRLPGWLLATDGAGPSLFGYYTGRVAPASLTVLEDTRTRTRRAAETTISKLLTGVLAARTHDDCSVGALQVDARGHGVPRRRMA